MQLTWHRVKNLTTDTDNPVPKYVDKLFVGNEPNNDIYQYYIKDGREGDKQSHITSSGYSSVVWGAAQQILTGQKLRNLGIKTFPQVGAIGFYTLLYEESGKLIAPIHASKEVISAPALVLTETATQLQFTITSPTGVSYECYRIILRSGYFAAEYITYEPTFAIALPSAGTYDIYCVGYAGEGQPASAESNHISKTIANSQAPAEITIVGMSVVNGSYLKLALSDGTEVISSSAILEVLNE